MKHSYYLTVDLGASNGRGIVFSYNGSSLVPIEEFRFPNGIVTRNGTDHWDFAYLLQNVKQTIAAAAERYPLRSAAVDTWGLDYGLLDKNGALLDEPVSYRDSRTVGIPEAVEKHISARELYEITGIQKLQGNTLYQLYAQLLDPAQPLARAEQLLMMPDLLRYFLTGERFAEYTISTTSQMLDIRAGTWSRALLDRLGLPAELFAPVIRPGKQAFALHPELCGGKKLPLVTAASHDTASAVAALPTEDAAPLYVSSGTWSVLGTELSEPLICDEGYALNFANEGGADGSIRYCSSLTGLWLLQECVRNWRERRQICDYAALDRLAQDAAPFVSLFDPQDPSLQAICDMPAAIGALCAANGMHVPQTMGEFTRAIYEAIALNYRRAVDRLERLTARSYDKLYVIGGGSRAELLNQCIANATGKTVVAGMPEATAFGNAFAQLLYDGEVSGLPDFRGMLAASQPLRYYTPEQSAEWEAAYDRFQTNCG